ncbi:hypothetical protein Y1Q_0008565 [Alligator mississippiensis]|uniref:Uncharacterized protein n=1 Tax=Alligator mississippiensis TaxID=8496 RepID=A0A151NR75_ALLMI|nr:hypothetical protein Y1Q_0008565 [Alligator mississippiensis]
MAGLRFRVTPIFMKPCEKWAYFRTGVSSDGQNYVGPEWVFQEFVNDFMHWVDVGTIMRDSVADGANESGAEERDVIYGM